MFYFNKQDQSLPKMCQRGEERCALFVCAVREARESRATVSVAPATQACHPERSEGSRCPAHQTLRYAQGDRRGLRVTLDGMPPGERGGRPGTRVQKLSAHPESDYCLTSMIHCWCRGGVTQW